MSQEIFNQGGFFFCWKYWLNLLRFCNAYTSIIGRTRSEMRMETKTDLKTKTNKFYTFGILLCFTLFISLFCHLAEDLVIVLIANQIITMPSRMSVWDKRHTHRLQCCSWSQSIDENWHLRSLRPKTNKPLMLMIYFSLSSLSVQLCGSHFRTPRHDSETAGTGDGL